jgi:hypothetical protein
VDETTGLVPDPIAGPIVVLRGQAADAVVLPHPVRPEREEPGRRPDVFDGAAAVAQSLLADQLAHDVDTLSTINEDVKESRNLITHRLVPYIFVAPSDRLAIGRLATDVYNRHYAGAPGLHRNRELEVLGWLLDAGRNRSAATC